MKIMLGIEHRSNGILGYQKKDGSYVAILKAPKSKISIAKIVWGDPYD
jgi:hypothetical protein